MASALPSAPSDHPAHAIPPKIRSSCHFGDAWPQIDCPPLLFDAYTPPHRACPQLSEIHEITTLRRGKLRMNDQIN